MAFPTWHDETHEFSGMKCDDLDTSFWRGTGVDGTVTLHGGTLVAPGSLLGGHAIHLANANTGSVPTDYIEMPWMWGYLSYAVTFAFWINPDVHAGEVFILGDASYGLLINSEGILIFRNSSDPPDYPTGIHVPSGEWTHLVFDNDLVTNIYKNGELGCTFPSGKYIDWYSLSFGQFGTQNPSGTQTNNFNGSLDNIRWYSFGYSGQKPGPNLSDAEVYGIYLNEIGQYNPCFYNSFPPGRNYCLTYPMDDLSGSPATTTARVNMTGDAADLVPVPTQGLALVLGRLGNCFYFDNVVGQTPTAMIINQGQATDFWVPTSLGLNFAVWLKLKPGGGDRYHCVMSDAEGAYRFYVGPDLPVMFIANGVSFFSTANLPSAGVWYHLVITVNPAGAINFYVDATKLGDTVPGAIFTLGWDCDYIGHAGNPTTPFAGWMDELQIIWNRVIAPEEITCDVCEGEFRAISIPCREIHSDPIGDVTPVTGWRYVDPTTWYVECNIPAYDIGLAEDGPMESSGCLPNVQYSFFFDNPTSGLPTHFVEVSTWALSYLRAFAAWIKIPASQVGRWMVLVNSDVGVDFFHPATVAVMLGEDGSLHCGAGLNYDHNPNELPGDLIYHVNDDVGISPDEWFHLAYSRDDYSGLSEKFYVNGVQLGSTQAVTRTATRPTMIGSHGDDGSLYHFNGYMCEIRMDWMAWTEGQIRNDYANGLCGPGLVDYQIINRYDIPVPTLKITADNPSREIINEYDSPNAQVQICHSDELQYAVVNAYDLPSPALLSPGLASVPDYGITNVLYTGTTGWIIEMADYAVENKWDMPEPLQVVRRGTAFDAIFRRGEFAFDEFSGDLNRVAAFAQDQADAFSAELEAMLFFDASFKSAWTEGKDLFRADMGWAAEFIEAESILVASLDVAYIFDFVAETEGDSLSADLVPTVILDAEWLGMADQLAATLDVPSSFGLAVEDRTRFAAAFLVGNVLAGEFASTEDVMEAILWVDPGLTAAFTNEDLDAFRAEIETADRFVGKILAHQRWR